jgi:serine/threonine-protein kinase RsbW
VPFRGERFRLKIAFTACFFRVDTRATLPYDGGALARLHDDKILACLVSVGGCFGLGFGKILSGMVKGTEMGSDSNERVVKIILPNMVGYERIAMASLASFARMFDFSPDRIEDLKTIVAEAAINAMQHGNKGRPDAVVTVAINFKDGAIQILVTDEGNGIKEMFPKPDIDRIINELDPPIGFGIFLIRELVDEVEFNLDTDKGHCLRMVVKK